jgi:hypothetical protein
VKDRIVIWAIAGFLVASGWGIYFSAAHNDHPMEPIMSSLLRLTCPIAIVGMHHPVSLNSSIVANIATICAGRSNGGNSTTAIKSLQVIQYTSLPHVPKARSGEFGAISRLTGQVECWSSGTCPITAALIVQVEDICRKLPRTPFWMTSGLPTPRSELSRFIRGQYRG